MLRFLIFSLLFSLICTGIIYMLILRKRHILNLRFKCEKLDNEIREKEADAKFYKAKNNKIEKEIEIMEQNTKEIEKRKKLKNKISKGKLK